MLLALFVALPVSCVKTSDPIDNGTDISNHTTNFAPTDGEAISGVLTLTVSTAPYGGNYAPKNIVALWVEDNEGKFVKTLGVHAAKRINYLGAWKTSQGSTQTDGDTGATRSNHLTPLTVIWDGTYADDVKKMKKDIYRLRGELTDRNGNGATFSEEIDLSAGDDVIDTTTPTSVFTTISAVFTAAP